MPVVLREVRMVLVAQTIVGQTTYGRRRHGMISISKGQIRLPAEERMVHEFYG